MDSYNVIKRGMDIIGSTLGLIATMPIIMVSAIAIRITMGEPIIFVQKRPGKNAKIFDMKKLRTMREVNSEDDMENDEKGRITTLGRYLRATSIDELPALVNVLKGEMSLVGPRPLLVKYLDIYTSEQARRHEVKPGITGWAQVNGRNALSWEEKFEHDVWYVENKSMALDLKILAMTVLKVLKREGISAENEATMPEFIGSKKEEDKRKI